MVRYKVRRSKDGKYATGARPFGPISWGKGFDYLKQVDAEKCARMCRYHIKAYPEWEGDWGTIEVVKITYEIINEEVVA